MFIKALLLSVLISITAAQNCSRSDVLQSQSGSPNLKKSCITQLLNYKAMIGHVKDKFDEFYENIDNEPLGLASRNVLTQNRTEFNQSISAVLNKIASNIETLDLINNPQSLKRYCDKYVKITAGNINNLSNKIKKLNDQLATELNNSDLPWSEIEKYEKPISSGAKMIAVLDLSIKASQILWKVGRWTVGKFSTSGLAATQESTVAEFETALNQVINKELGAAEIGPEAEAAIQNSADAVVEHMRSGSSALEAAEEADGTMILASETSVEAAELTATATLIGAPEATIIVARAAQVARATQAFRATQALRLAASMRAVEASKIVETADAAETISISAETTEVAAIAEAAGLAEATAVGEAALVAEGAAEVASVTAITFGAVAPYAIGVIFLIDLANEAIKYAHKQYLRYHVDEKFAIALNATKQFGNDLMNLLLTTLKTSKFH